MEGLKSFSHSETLQQLFGTQPIPRIWPKGPLAYVEWYTKLKHHCEKDHGMYAISKATDSQGHIQGSVMPLSNICQSCMLFPIFHDMEEEKTWRQNDVLDEAK